MNEAENILILGGMIWLLMILLWMIIALATENRWNKNEKKE